LNAEPVALAACPGVSGAVELPHVWFGWPVACVAVVAFWLVAFWLMAAVFVVAAVVRASIMDLTMLMRAAS
jgi:hypothetical protein